MLSRISSGIALTLSLLNVVNAVTIPVRSEPSLKSSIAVKLSRDASVDGQDLVEGLVQKAQSTSGKAKRDVGFSVKPLFRSLSPEKIAEMVKKAKKITPSYEAPDFGAWYQVVFDTDAQDDDEELTELLDSIRRNEEISSGQTMSVSLNIPNVDASDDPLADGQGYLDPAVEGINARYAWGFDGGDGAGTTVIDIEMGWKLDHEDLAAAGIQLLAGNNPNRRGGYWPHGTAVLGEMLMVDNDLGGVGIVPSAQGHVVGVERGTGADLRESVAEAVLDAASFLEFGDVIITEAQIRLPNQRDYPIEVLDAEFEAISLAVALGITVVEPAGNGGVDLDEPILREGDTVASDFLNRASSNFRDSGALMVTMASSAAPHTRLELTNSGSRVDAYAWGENVLTTSCEGQSLPYLDTYVNFTGSSSAAPIVAGAVLSVQGMLVANGGSKLSPAEIQSLIVMGGTPSANGASDKMGSMPNLKALIDGGYLE